MAKRNDISIFFVVSISCQVLNDGSGEHRYDLHVVYSASYRVPVLYFRAYRNGKLTIGPQIIRNRIHTFCKSAQANYECIQLWQSQFFMGSLFLFAFLTAAISTETSVNYSHRLKLLNALKPTLPLTSISFQITNIMIAHVITKCVQFMLNEIHAILQMGSLCCQMSLKKTSLSIQLNF